MNYAYPEDIAAQTINFYLPPILLIIGTAGNIICLIVHIRLTQRMLTACFYLAFLALVDTFLLYIREANAWVNQVLDINVSINIINTSNASCQVYSFASNLLLHMSSWLLAAALCEVAMINAHPAVAHKRLSLDKTKNVLLIQVLILVCVNAHYFWTYGLEPDYNDPEIKFCTFTTFGNHYSEYFRDSVWPIMNMLSASIVPGVTLLICVVYILKMRKRHGRDALLRNTFLLHPEATNQQVLMCVGLGILSLIFTLPEFCYDSFEFIIEITEKVNDFTHLSFHSQRRLAQVVCISVRDIFLGFKFLFYCIGWRTFRLEVRDLFRKRRRRRRRGERHSVSREPLHSHEREDSETRHTCPT